MLLVHLLVLLFSYLVSTTLAAPAPSPAPIPANPITPSQGTYVILSADIDQPWSGNQTNVPETFSFTVAGQWQGATPVQCSLKWNAAVLRQTASGNLMITVRGMPCSDPGVSVVLTRYNVEPWYGWDIAVQAAGNQQAVWRVKNMYETPGWQLSTLGVWHFDGNGGKGHPIGAVPATTLGSCLRDNTCNSN